MTKRNIPIDKKKVLTELGFIPIPGYDGYWAREDGKIGSSNNRETGIVKILSPLVINSGYETVSLRTAIRGDERRTVHRLIAYAFLPNPNNLPEVNHKNGNKLNNRVDNLEWISISGNKRHALDNGLMKPAKGEMNWKSKLKEFQVVEIHKLYSDGIPVKEIADKFNISSRHVDTIAKAIEWKHLGLTPVWRGKSKGERHSKSVLNESQVLEIRKLASEGMTQPEIAKLFPCSASGISHIVNRHSWKHI